MAKNKIHYPSAFNEHYTDDCRNKVREIIDWINEAESNTQAWLAKSVNKSNGYISQLVNGTINAPAADLIKACLSAIKAQLNKVAPGEFVKTSVWSSLKFACNEARHTQGFAIMSGRKGIGKTRCAKQFCLEDPNAIYIMGCESMNNMALLDELIEKLRLPQSGGSVNKKQKLVVKHLRGTSRVLLLDEVDKCQNNVAETLRVILDDAEIGIVLLGNTELHTKVKTGEGKFEYIEERATYFAKVIPYLPRHDAELLAEPMIGDFRYAENETFSEFVLYAMHLCDGSGRKLVKNLLHHVCLQASVKRKKNEPFFLSRSLLQTLAKEFMGVENPPAYPIRRTTQIPVTN
jgi:DNA transposition AAA+ family ATPase